MIEHYWGIKGWTPAWVESAYVLGKTLTEMDVKGQKFNGVWTLWEGNDWFEDAPVVLNIGGGQLELCANKIGEFSITKDSIDVETPVSWCEEPSQTGNLLWQQNSHAELSVLRGRKITGVGVIEYRLDENIQGIFNQDWVLSGAYISCDNDHIEIFNALDCNGIASNRNYSDDFRYIANEV